MSVPQVQQIIVNSEGDAGVLRLFLTAVICIRDSREAARIAETTLLERFREEHKVQLDSLKKEW